MYDATPLRRIMNDMYTTLCMTMIISKCVGVVSLRYPRQGGYERFTLRGTGYAPQGRPARHWGSPMYPS